MKAFLKLNRVTLVMLTIGLILNILRGVLIRGFGFDYSAQHGFKLIYIFIFAGYLLLYFVFGFFAFRDLSLREMAVSLVISYFILAGMIILATAFGGVFENLFFNYGGQALIDESLRPLVSSAKQVNGNLFLFTLPWIMPSIFFYCRYIQLKAKTKKRFIEMFVDDGPDEMF
ncbi:MAG: hypothetical protein LBR25_00755 [Erysipelotrichaceae bacterium]|nr:hypothetical protein [Erysipelotrichaceae bacterium]